MFLLFTLLIAGFLIILSIMGLIVTWGFGGDAPTLYAIYASATAWIAWVSLWQGDFLAALLSFVVAAVGVFMFNRSNNQKGVSA